jgi:hypothetical protein
MTTTSLKQKNVTGHRLCLISITQAALNVMRQEAGADSDLRLNAMYAQDRFRSPGHRSLNILASRESALINRPGVARYDRDWHLLGWTVRIR